MARKKAKKPVVKKKLDPKLVRELKDELSEDLSRYDGEWDVWSEVVLDCPSNTMEELMGKIPKELQDEYYEMMEKYIASLE